MPCRSEPARWTVAGSSTANPWSRSYAYAAHNPVSYTDLTGLFVHQKLGGAVSTLVPDCPFGNSSNGWCRGSGTAQQYADDVANPPPVVLRPAGSPL